MDQREAEVLAVRIRREFPKVFAIVKQVTWIGGSAWAVAVIARGSNFLLGEVESPPEWDELKKRIQDHS